eukprot:5521479-Alexandrium_andersonii.AAC.1
MRVASGGRPWPTSRATALGSRRASPWKRASRAARTSRSPWQRPRAKPRRAGVAAPADAPE